MNVDWVKAQLDEFLTLTQMEPYSHEAGVRRRRAGSRTDILDASVVLEKIFDRLIPQWRDAVVERRTQRRHDDWDAHVDLCRRARVLVERQEEMREMLGDDAPELNASSLHPWIWEGAQSLWSSGHYREAVGVSAIKLNAELQNKTNRKDVSEIDLFKQAFTLEPRATWQTSITSDGRRRQ